ncbi:hypothetical protein [Dysosmobacter sp.]|uniref:hypothetical protein n=1 Tax=Dysosmobacter sp. TaxID=2591382 RepID=UPI002A8F15D6|nr:hypothetical protein [Dysosmobacter sp.]MDY3280886.1 hypothetical protein [Dysosmobacter sp.]
MKGIRLLSLLTALTMLACCVTVSASETDWLIPRQRDYRSFTDTAGTICENAAATCCQAGLMDGVDSRHFLPEVGLSHAQIIVIAARFHRLLSGGSLDYFEPISITGPDWWTPYDGYLTERIPALADAAWYQSGKVIPTSPCSREAFFRLLAAVLENLNVTLPEINEVSAVPDCMDETILQFYRWGILNGKDPYGSLHGSAALSRAAAAAMLARLIDPAQRLTFEPQTLDLCRDMLDTDPETVLAVIGGQSLTAAQIAPTLARYLDSHNRSHLLHTTAPEMAREAVNAMVADAAMERLAARYGIPLPEGNPAGAGYMGCSAAGMAWDDQHRQLEQLVTALFPARADYDAALRDTAARLTVELTDAWAALDMEACAARLRQLPGWQLFQ